MNIKKIFSAISAVALSLGMTVSIPVHASTANSSWYGGGSFVRDKDDYTSIYIQNVSDYYYAWVTVKGRKSGDNTDYEVNVSDLDGQTVTTHDLTIPARSERLVRQFVKENDCQFAKVIFTGGGSGWWSPDSVGSYTYAN